jgi:hypothetical protein
MKSIEEGSKDYKAGNFTLRKKYGEIWKKNKN